jgi:hypothetical protein
MLIRQCRKEGIGMLGWDEGEDYWVAGWVGASKRLNMAVWEEFLPPTLLMRARIRGLSLDELEALMVTFTQEQGAVVGRNRVRVGAGAIAAASLTSLTQLRRLVSFQDIIRQVQRERSESGSVFQLTESSEQ